MSTQRYKITLTRWDSKAGERRNRESFIEAESFDSAYDVARYAVRELQAADSSRTYELGGIHNDGLGGVTVYQDWLTQEEFSQWVKDQEESNND